MTTTKNTLLVFLLVLLFATPVQAQKALFDVDQPTTTATDATWLTDVRAYFTFDKMKSSDKDFILGAEVGFGVTIMQVNPCKWDFGAYHEGILGRDEDPTTLDIIEYGFQMSGGCGPVKVFVRHRCRHLSDRYNPFTVAWNSVGVEVGREFRSEDGWVLMAAINFQNVIGRNYADYGKIGELNLGIRRSLSKDASLYASAFGDAISVVKTTLPPRENLTGASFEYGVRLEGSRGVAEIFGAYGRTIDMFTLGRKRERDVRVGIRISLK